MGRRSVPAARAELIVWAATVASRNRQRPLGEALRADLAHGPTRLTAGADVDLPPPPAPSGRGRGDLSARIAACLEAPDFPDPTRERGASR